MTEYLTLEEAAVYLGLTGTSCLTNCIKSGELVGIRKGKQLTIARKELDRWKSERRLFTLDIRDYMKCLRFALDSLYKYCPLSSTSCNTTAGSARIVDNFTSQRLGEVAFQRFMEKQFKTFVKFNFEFRDIVTSQDITEVALPGNRLRVYNPPKLKLSIETAKVNRWQLAIPQAEIEDQEHRSDAYVMVRIGLPPDHLFRILSRAVDTYLGIVREEAIFPRLEHLEADLGITAEEVPIPQFEPVWAEVMGYAWRSDLLKAELSAGADKPKALPSYFLPTGSLRRSDAEWQRLIERL
ncbi:MAG: helix-turn-helix domain-containing protein [Dehalococcoidales bacterium]|nr:helix-turn-helix domain-containing protein [Dehalococcoidales bacterium]